MRLLILAGLLSLALGACDLSGPYCLEDKCFATLAEYLDERDAQVTIDLPICPQAEEVCFYWTEGE